MSKRPRILIFTGNGKGKTTAALGMALRMTGHGHRVCIIQFIKNDSSTGEFIAAANIPNLEIHQTGQGFFKNNNHFNDHRQAAQNGFQRACEALASNRYHMIVLDEICVAVTKGLIDTAQVIDLLNNASSEGVIAMTGRDASTELIDLADTVTEMRCVKHGFAAGISAQQGVEY